VFNLAGPRRPAAPHPSVVRPERRNAARGRLLQLGAGLFAVAALVYTAKNFTLSREGQMTDRYTKAVEQLGSDKLDVRIGGIYALERVARDSPRDRLTVKAVSQPLDQGFRGRPLADPLPGIGRDALDGPRSGPPENWPISPT
jgi:hypothetical protein